MKTSWSNVYLYNEFETQFNGYILVSACVSFIPDVDLDCKPPYIKGKQDSCWVKFRKGNKPTTKEGWEKLIGMKLQSMVNLDKLPLDNSK